MCTTSARRFCLSPPIASRRSMSSSRPASPTRDASSIRSPISGSSISLRSRITFWNPISEFSIRGARTSRIARTQRHRAKVQRHSDRVRRARISGRIGLEGVSAVGDRVRNPSSARSENREQVAASDLHPCDEGRNRPRREHPVRADVGDHRRGPRRAASRSHPEDLSTGSRLRAVAPHHHRRHQVRIWVAQRPGDLDRRSAHARFIALLAHTISMRSEKIRRRSTSSSCATGSNRRDGTRIRRRPSSRPRSSQRRARNMSRRSGN